MLENKVILRKIGKEYAGYRVFCFPYAGAGASVYINIPETEDVQYCLVQLPGRENRKSERLVDDAEYLADMLTMELLEFIDRPFALYGHSMGGVLAYLVAVRLERLNIRPDKLYLSASSIYRKKRTVEVSHMDTEKLTEYLKELGGMAPEAATNKNLQDLYYPIIKNDYKLVENYEPDEQKILCGILAFASKSDKEVEWEEAVRMRNMTDNFSLKEVHGNHFFIKTDTSYIFNEISDDLRKTPKKNPNICKVLGDVVCLWKDNERNLITVDKWQNEKKIPYKEMGKRVINMGEALKSLGIANGDTVLLQISDIMDQISVLWACFYSGIIVVPVECRLDMEYRKEQENVIRLKKIADIVKPKAVIAGAEEYSNVCELLKEQRIITVDEIKAKDCKSEIASGVRVHILPKDCAMIVFTSGSTGEPKGVMLTHENIISGIYGDILASKENAQEVFLNWMPLEHVASLVMNHILQAVIGAEQIQVRTGIILEDIKRWLIMQSKYNVNHTWAPNFAYELINQEIKNILQMELNLSSVKTWVNAGEIINYKICDKVVTKLKKTELRQNVMVPCWGMTEAATGILYSYTFGRNVINNTVTVGKPIPGMQARIVDDENRGLEADNEGKLQIRGKALFTRYLNVHDNLCFTSDGWFETGDCGKIVDGEVFITGRRKDIFIVNGCNISCYEIENGINKITGINLVQAVTKRDIDSGKEEMHIFISKENINEHTLSQIRTFLANRYSISFKAVYALEEKEFPRTVIGKIDKKKLISKYGAEKYILHDKKVQKASTNNTSVEKKLADIWEKVLDISDIRKDEDFFYLGGTSIKIPVLLEKINKEIGTNISVSMFFENPTIAGVSQIIKRGTLEVDQTQECAGSADEENSEIPFIVI